MIFVLAPNYQQAEHWAKFNSDPPLSPKEWHYVSGINVLRGSTKITIVIYNDRGEWSPQMNRVKTEIRMIKIHGNPYNWSIKDARNND